MIESEYLRFLISQKPSDYPETRILLKELIKAVNHIETNINQIVHNHNFGFYSDADKDQLLAYMRKMNVDVNKVYETINKGKFAN